MNETRVALMIVPYDSGNRGMRMGAGPDKLLESGMETALAAGGCDSTTTRIELPDGFFPAEVQAAFELNRRLSDAVRRACHGGAFPLILSGNCNTALGTLSGLGQEDIGIMWFDAHGDFNTPETTSSGFFDGMALATATGKCWSQLVGTIPGFHVVEERRVIHLGARDFDPAEKQLLSRSAIAVLSPEDVRQDLGSRITRHREEMRGIYLHVDLDVLDKSEGSANGYAVEGGLKAPELSAAIIEIGKLFRVRAAAITSYDPSFDPDGTVARIAIDIASTIASLASGVGAGRQADMS